MYFILSALIAFTTLSHADGPLLREDLAEGRITDVTRVKKLTGKGSFLFFRAPKYGNFLEGYVRGMITDYNDHPIEGVVVRAVVTSVATSKKKKKSEEELLLEAGLEEGAREKIVEETPNIDPGLSDGDGVYRLHFSFPIFSGKVDIRAKILYSPDWSQQYDVLGQAYEPQQKESDFRLFYEEKTKLLVFSEGTRKTVVRPVRNSAIGPATLKLKGTDKPETVESIQNKNKPATPTPGASAPGGSPGKPPEKKEDEDFFKGFNFGQ